MRSFSRSRMSLWNKHCDFIASYWVQYKNYCWYVITWAVQIMMLDEWRGCLHPLYSLKQQTQWLSPLHNVCRDAKTKSFGETNVLKNCMSGNGRRRLSVSKAAQTLWSDLLCRNGQPGFPLFLFFTCSPYCHPRLPHLLYLKIISAVDMFFVWVCWFLLWGHLMQWDALAQHQLCCSWASLLGSSKVLVSPSSASGTCDAFL